MTNATLASAIDDECGNLEKALADIFGIPIDTDITGPLFTASTSGMQALKTIHTGADPTVTGDIQRNGDRLRFHDGTRAQDLVTPTGIIVGFGGAVAPSGWLLCDGAAVSRTTFADLFAIIGVAYGVGDGATTFNVPNLQGRSLVGRDVTQTEFDPLGQTGGSKSQAHQHTHGHTHTQQGVTGQANQVQGGNFAAGGAAYTDQGHTHNQQGETSGANPSTTDAQTINVLNPYQVANWIIKT